MLHEICGLDGFGLAEVLLARRHASAACTRVLGRVYNVAKRREVLFEILLLPFASFLRGQFHRADLSRRLLKSLGIE